MVDSRHGGRVHVVARPGQAVLTTDHADRRHGFEQRGPRRRTPVEVEHEGRTDWNASSPRRGRERGDTVDGEARGESVGVSREGCDGRVPGDGGSTDGSDGCRSPTPLFRVEPIGRASGPERRAGRQPTAGIGSEISRV